MDTITYVVSITPEKRLRFYRLDENGLPTLVPTDSLPSRLKAYGYSLYAWVNDRPCNCSTRGQDGLTL